MSHKTSREKNTARRKRDEFDPLDDVENESGIELPKKAHERAEKPTQLPKKIRSSPKESYRPMHRKK